MIGRDRLTACEHLVHFIRLDEGCSPAVEKTGYEDYGTYFFAALTGHPREHAGLSGRPDWNLDMWVPPLEAHFHVLATTFSADVPRPTSEVLLLQWRLGNLEDVLADGDRDKNEYTELAREMMRWNGISRQLDPDKEMYRRQRWLEDQWERLELDHKRLHGENVSLRDAIKRDVLRRWHRATASCTLGFKRLLEEDLE